MQRLGVEPSRSGGREGYSLAGVRPRLTLRNGARCRLSACDARFVGPTLFTSELTGHRMATTSGNDPLSPSRQLGCDTCRISGQIGCRPAARTQRVRINSPVPTPGGTVGKNRIGAECGNRTRVICLEGRGPKPLDQPRSKWRALCLALRLPVSMRRIVACAGLWAGVFGWSQSAGPSLFVPVCPRPCAGGKANQNSIALVRGWNFPTKECDHDGL